MTNEAETVSSQGSLWRRWDPHIHAPGTVLNDGYVGADPWSAFLEKIEKSDPPIRALGITDYCNIECYAKTLKHQKSGRLQGVGLIFPNIEFRLTIETSKGTGVNLHVLVSPEAPDHVEQIEAFLSRLTFRHQEETFGCARDDLIRLGRTFDAALVDDEAAHREGINQFKVSLEALQDAFSGSAWLRANCLVAVAGGSSDGTSGLQGDGGQWAATRKNIERSAHIIFSANPKQIAFYLGRGAASLADLEEKWGGRKPCLHGSDAHTADRVGKPDQARFCWLNGDLTFDTLRQAVIEPEGRVHIGESAPQGALPGNAIQSVQVTNAPWMRPSQLPLNAGMVAIIGARGSGKTALADFIAAGAYGFSQRPSENSFLRRAGKFLKATSVNLEWESLTFTQDEVSRVAAGVGADVAQVQYLSQQFVEELCSSEGLNDSLIVEIQRVVFEAHPDESRLDAPDFATLLDWRMQAAREARDRHHHDLQRAADGINSEIVRRDGRPKLEKERDESLRLLKKDREDRSKLVPKGQEARAKRLEEITNAVEARQRTLAAINERILALTGLEKDVARFREQEAPEWLVDAQERRAGANLTENDWKDFRLDFVGDVNALLKQRLDHARREATKLQGAPAGPPFAGAPVSDPTIAIIPEDAELSTQTLSLLSQERARLQKLVGIDEQNARRYKALTEKITRAETALAKQNKEIERAQKVEEALKTLRAARDEAYRGIFSAIVQEERELELLYAPLQEKISAGARAVKKLSFSIRRQVDVDAWAARGEQLLDLRREPFRGRGELGKAAETVLGQAWREGGAEEAATAMR